MDEVGRFPQAFGTALQVADLLAGGRREIAVAGDPGDPAAAALAAVARDRGGPGAVVAVGHPDDAAAVDAAPLLAGRPLVDGRPAAYVCRAWTCHAPVTTPEALAASLGAT